METIKLDENLYRIRLVLEEAKRNENGELCEQEIRSLLISAGNTNGNTVFERYAEMLASVNRRDSPRRFK